MPETTPLLQLEWGVQAAQSGNRTLARKHLLDALQAFPDNVSCRVWLAWTASSPADALALLEQAPQENCNDEMLVIGKQWLRQLAEFDLSRRSVHDAGASDFDGADGPEELLSHQVREMSQSLTTEMRLLQNKLSDDVALIDYAPIDNTAGQTPEQAPKQQIQPDNLTQNPVKISHKAGKPVASSPPLVLSVDDSPTVRRLLQITLESCGYRVVGAPSAAAALQIIGEEKPSLMLLDVVMPEMDGFQLCKILKRNKETRKIPVILLTSKGGLIDIVRAKFAGCKGYFTKPFNAKELVHRVKALAPVDA